MRPTVPAVGEHCRVGQTCAAEQRLKLLSNYERVCPPQTKQNALRRQPQGVFHAHDDKIAHGYQSPIARNMTASTAYSSHPPTGRGEDQGVKVATRSRPSRTGPPSARRGSLLAPRQRGSPKTPRGTATAATPRHQRGNSLSPIKNSSTERAAWRPSRIAHTTRLWPRRMSPAANTLFTLVA